MKNAVRALVGIAAAAVLTSACGGSSGSSSGALKSSGAVGAATTSPRAAAGTSSTTATTAAPGAALPIACTAVTSGGTFTDPGPAQVTIDQVGQAIGFPVAGSMPATQSALGFHGYEGCSYTFTTPAGGANLDVSAVIGTDPTRLTRTTAADEFAATRQNSMPQSQRDCTGNGCAWTVTPTPGLGDSALVLTQSGGSVVAALKGDVYVEVGPGNLKVERELALARVLLDSLH